MIISKQKRFLFAAFNKTGTTSIEEALTKYGSSFLELRLRLLHRLIVHDGHMFKHVRPLYLKRLLGATEWNRYFKFSYVRNPWSRAVSLYFYHRKNPTKYPLAQRSFEEWVCRGGTGTIRKSMSEFVSDDNGNIIMDFIGRYENLETDFEQICGRIGLGRIELPHLNKSTNNSYKDYYNERTKRIVEEWSKRDIETFGYEF